MTTRQKIEEFILDGGSTYRCDFCSAPDSEYIKKLERIARASCDLVELLENRKGRIIPAKDINKALATFEKAVEK